MTINIFMPAVAVGVVAVLFIALIIKTMIETLL